QHDSIDQAIAGWTRTLDAKQAAAQLQAIGVAATPTLSPADVLRDEHLAARAFVSQVESLVGGSRATLGVPWRIDGQRPADRRRCLRAGASSGGGREASPTVASVLAGAGRAFCSGDELGRERTPDEALPSRRRGNIKHYGSGPGRWTSTVKLMRNLPQPIVTR